MYLKGWFTLATFDVCGCGRRLRFHRDRKFSIFPLCTLLPQPHAAHLNEPLDTFYVWNVKDGNECIRMTSRYEEWCFYSPEKQIENKVEQRLYVFWIPSKWRIEVIESRDKLIDRWPFSFRYVQCNIINLQNLFQPSHVCGCNLSSVHIRADDAT